MTVSRADIPPAQPKLVEVGGLSECGEKQGSFIAQQMGDVDDDSIRKGNMLHHFEAGDEIEAFPRAIGKCSERIERCRAKAFLGKSACEQTVSASIVEDGKRFARSAKCLCHDLSVVTWPSSDVIRIDDRVV